MSSPPVDPPPGSPADPAGGASGPAPRRLVLMDFDGVLVREDSFGLFLRHRLVRAPWRMPAFAATSTAVAPLVGLRASRSRGLGFVVRAGLAGLTLEDYRARAQVFGTALAARPGGLLRPGVAAARAHLDAGDRLVVVTGSEQTLARAILDAAGLPDAELVASRVDRTPLGLSFAVHAYGERKVRELEARGIRPPWDVAYSDSPVDLPMLRGARSAVLVNVGPRYGAAARAILGDRVTDVVWR